ELAVILEDRTRTSAGPQGAVRAPATLRSLLMRRLRAAALLVPALALTLSACGGGSSAYCDTLTDNSAVSATVFAPAIPGMATSEQVEERLDLLEQVEDDVPEEIQEEFTIWQQHLEEIGPKLDSEDSEELNEVIQSRTDEVAAAGETLSDHYTGTCMD